MELLEIRTLSFDNITKIIPKDSLETREVSEWLSKQIINYENRYKLNAIDAVMKMCNDNEIKIDDITDYLAYDEDLKDRIFNDIKYSDNNYYKDIIGYDSDNALSSFGF